MLESNRTVVAHLVLLTISQSVAKWHTRSNSIQTNELAIRSSTFRNLIGKSKGLTRGVSRRSLCGSAFIQSSFLPESWLRIGFPLIHPILTANNRFKSQQSGRGHLSSGTFPSASSPLTRHITCYLYLLKSRTR